MTETQPCPREPGFGGETPQGPGAADTWAGQLWAGAPGSCLVA